MDRIPASHFVSVQMTSGVRLYGKLHTAGDARFVRLTSVKVLAAQPASGGAKAPTLGLTSQNETYLDCSQILSVVDIGAHPAAEG